MEYLASGPNGISGFRKNFNIQTLIDKMKTDRNVAKKIDIPKKLLEYCEEHTSETAHYYCQDTKCGKIICESCWSSEHENHSVILLSKWVKNYKANVRQDIDKCMEYFTDPVTETLRAKETIEKLEEKIQKILLDINDEKEKIRRENTTLHDQKEQVSLLHSALEDASLLKEAMEVKGKVENLKESIENWRFKYPD